MTKLSTPDQIWHLKPTTEDLEAGARYASLTLPWTFNRMMINTKSRGQQDRALNIAKGIVAQEILRRELKRRGIKAQVQRKSHRADDLFDFKIRTGRLVNLDVKTTNHYKNYPGDERPPFSREFVIENMAYPGPDWRYFFPMLIPHTQINQDKEAYCFAIASSIDFRHDINTDRSGYALSAFPYDEHLPFLASKKLILAREQAQQGIFIQCLYVSEGLFSGQSQKLRIVGEWMDQVEELEIQLSSGEPSKPIGPFSSVNCFQIDPRVHEEMFGHFEITIVENGLDVPIYNSTKRDINQKPVEPLVIGREDFCNLILPNEYEVYVIGWIMKQEFLERCREYPAWVWPADKDDRYVNQAWTQITENDIQALSHAGFEDRIQKKPSRINAGWMKTSGRGNGACCYVFPNSYGGGIRETNLYVLPQDLTIMDELGTI